MCVLQLAGNAESVSLVKLSEYLVGRGDVPLEKIQSVFNELDMNGDGSVDRAEWRVGFSKGLTSTGVRTRVG